MRDEHISTANYAAVIADLRAKRDEIDRTIAMLERMSFVEPLRHQEQHTGAAAVRPIPMSPAESKPHKQSPSVGSLGIGEACARAVREHGADQPLSTRQVTDLVLASGFRIDTANPVNNVWSALNQRAKVAKDIERVGKGWQYAGRPEKDALPAQAAHMNGQTRTSL